MVLEIGFSENKDMHRCFEIISKAFGDREAYINAMFPHHHTPEGRKIGGDRYIMTKNADPFSRFLKVTDTETGEIVGQAKWIVVGHEKPPEVALQGDWWDTEEDKIYAQHMYEVFLVGRRSAIKNAKGPLLALDILTVDPKYQKRGAGKLLVQWGTKLADEMVAEAIVEASPAGRYLYEQNGFVFKHEVTLQVPEKWEHKPKQSFLWMVRPARTESKLELQG